MVYESVKIFGSSLLPAMLSRGVTYKLHKILKNLRLQRRCMLKNISIDCVLCLSCASS